MLDTANTVAESAASTVTADDLGWAMDFDADSPTALETPTSTDALHEAVADATEHTGADGKSTEAGTDKAATEGTPATPHADAPSAPAKDEAKASEEDSDLSPTDRELIESRPKAEQPELERRFKAAKFEDHYKNPLKPAEEVREYLQQQSPSRYAELERAVVERQLADPERFASEVFTKSPEAYGKLARTVFDSDPAYFIKELTGREEVVPETLKTALDFYERNRDRADLQGNALAGNVDGLTDEAIAELRAWVPETADAVIALRERAAALEAANATNAKSTDPNAPDEAQKAEAERIKQIEADTANKQAEDEVWNASYGEMQSFLERKFDEEYGLKVTPEERTKAPLVALVKDFKRNVLLNGFGDIPGFEDGITEYAGAREDFQTSVQKLGHFVTAKEKDNAVQAMRALFPVADKYAGERVKAPIIAQLDQLMQLAVRAANPRTEVEEYIPGAANISRQNDDSDPLERLNTSLIEAAFV